jgi:hypothetical protein
MADTLNTYLSMVQDDVDDNSLTTVSLLQTYIKEVYQEILERCGMFLITPTVTDTVVTPDLASYVPTTEPLEILGVFYHSASNTDFSKLTEIKEFEYLDSWMNADSGTPTYFYKKGLGISLVPAPVDAGTMRIVTIDVQPELTGASIIPTRFSSVVKNGAVYKYKAFDDNPSANEYEGYYRRGLHDMELELMTKTPVLKPKLFGL